MDKIFDFAHEKDASYPNGKPRIIAGHTQVLWAIVVAFCLILGLAIRYKFIWFETRDWQLFLSVWVESFRQQGFSFLATDSYDYMPTYMYLLFIAAQFGHYALPVTKLFSIVFDFVLAIATGMVAYKLFEQKKPEQKFFYAVGTGCFIWLLPTVISNSSMWGQCDSIYASFLLICLYCFLCDKSDAAMVMFSLAMAIKLQAVFWLPVILLLWVYKRVKTYQFAYIPAALFICVIPAWIAGRPIGQLMTIYMSQMGSYGERLSMKYPNIYYLIGELNLIDYYSSAGVYFTIGLLLIYMVYVLYKLMERKLDGNLLIQILYTSGLIILYFLPHMHERYGYSFEILACLYVLTNRKRFWIVPVQIVTTFLTYSYYYNYESEKVIPIPWLALVNLVILLVVLWDSAKVLNEKGCD